MVEDPDLLAPMYIKAGCSLITVHVETTRHLDRSLASINDNGARAAVTLNPGTPIETVENVLHLVDMVLIMSVNPGFGGQKYIAAQETKVAKLRSWIVERDLDVDIEIDGGISPITIEQATRAGANVFVAGSAVFNDPEGPAHAIATLTQLAEAATIGLMAPHLARRLFAAFALITFAAGCSGSADDTRRSVCVL